MNDNVLTLDIPKILTERYYEKVFLKHINGVLKKADIDSPPILVLDLSNLKLIGPMAILNLLVLGGYIERTYNALVQVVLPETQSVLHFLENRHFFSYASDVLFYDYEELIEKMGFERETTLVKSDIFTPIYRIQYSNDIRTAVSGIQRIGINLLALFLGHELDKTELFLDVLCELCQNIADHSESWGYTTVQKITYRGVEWVKICVADGGIGIKQSLSKRDSKFENIRDGDALIHVISSDVSSPDRELGLYAITQIVKDWQGVISIRSGDAKIKAYSSGGRELYKDLYWFPGVQVDVSFPKADSQGQYL